MATFGSFADLTPAQVELAQRRQASGGDPLSALIQGLTQGVQINQMPQQLANQALSQQLAAQLGQIKLLTAQKQLAELMKTPADRAREALTMQQVQRALATESLTEAAAGLGTIYDPSSVGVTSNQLAALEQASQAPQMDEVTIPTAEFPSSDLSLGGQIVPSGLQLQTDQLPTIDQAIGNAILRSRQPSFQVPSSPLRGVEREIQGLPGLYRSSAAEREFIQNEIAKQRQVELNKIRQFAPGSSLGSGAEGIIFTAPERGVKPENFTLSPGQKVFNPQGQVIAENPGGSNQNRPISVPPGGKVIDTQGKLIFENTSSSSSSTGGRGMTPTGEENAKFRSGLSIIGQVDDTLKVANEIQKTGKFPKGFQIAVNQFLGQRPQDIPGAGLVPGFTEAYAVAQNLSRGAQTKESRDVQMRKAMLSSTILRLQAGLSQTLGESLNIAPYVPSESDSYDSLVDKLNLTRESAVRELNIQRRMFPSLAAIPSPELGDSINVTPAPSGGGRSFSTEAEARAAGFGNDDYVIINGVPAQLE